MKILIFLISLLCSLTSISQLKPKDQCAVFNVDILHGIVNEVLKPNSNPDYIKQVLPCFTSEEQGDNAKCGGGIFYKDRDIYFYSQRKYIEIGEKFKGKLSIPLLGAKRNSLFRLLGNPVLKDPGWDAYQTAYGCLVLHYNKAGKVNKIQFSTNGTSTLQLCN